MTSPRYAVYPIRIAESDLRKINQSIRPSLARFAEKDGGGLYATIEIGHQLHCLVRGLIPNQCSALQHRHSEGLPPAQQHLGGFQLHRLRNQTAVSTREGYWAGDLSNLTYGFIHQLPEACSSTVSTRFVRAKDLGQLHYAPRRFASRRVSYSISSSPLPMH